MQVKENWGIAPTEVKEVVSTIKTVALPTMDELKDAIMQFDPFYWASENKALYRKGIVLQGIIDSGEPMFVELWEAAKTDEQLKSKLERITKGWISK